MPHSAADHALIVIRAALNAVPVVGGSVASLIGDYVPLSTQRSIGRASELIAQRLCTLEARLAADLIDKDEFADLFKSCYITIVRTTNETKLRAATSILVNLLLRPGDPEKLSYTELDHFTRCLEALSIGAISILGTATELVTRFRIEPDSEGSYRFTFEQLHSKLRAIDASLFMGLVGELNTFNLIRISGFPPIRMPEYGNHQLELTSLGKRFVDRILAA